MKNDTDEVVNKYMVKSIVDSQIISSPLKKSSQDSFASSFSLRNEGGALQRSAYKKRNKKAFEYYECG